MDSTKSIGILPVTSPFRRPPNSQEMTTEDLLCPFIRKIPYNQININILTMLTNKDDIEHLISQPPWPYHNPPDQREKMLEKFIIAELTGLFNQEAPDPLPSLDRCAIIHCRSVGVSFRGNLRI